MYERERFLTFFRIISGIILIFYPENSFRDSFMSCIFKTSSCWGLNANDGNVYLFVLFLIYLGLIDLNSSLMYNLESSNLVFKIGFSIWRINFFSLLWPLYGFELRIYELFCYSFSNLISRMLSYSIVFIISY